MAANHSPMIRPLFTIEQIELIRRLRNSGITKEEVNHAFDSLDRLDNELRPLSRSPICTCPDEISSPQITTNNRLSVNQSISSQNGGGVSCEVTGGLELLDENCSNLSNTSSNDLSLIGTTCSTSAGRASSISVTGITDDESEELKEFLKKGEEAIYEEIRNFVQQHPVTQIQIGAGSGISQSYVSRYLRGDYSDMSEKSCKAIYCWYLSTRKKTIPNSRSNPVLYRPITGVTPNVMTIVGSIESSLSSAVDTYTSGSAPQRRERFTFRSCHLEVLERFFTEDQYPNAEKREEISIACNMAVNREVVGRKLTEREKVHPHIVANWFANRRKELKKMARDEGVDTSTLLLSGRGRWKSNSGEGSGLDPSPLSDDSERPFGVDHLESDDQSLSMAVEVAAVNQAILSLTGQTPSQGIKHELLSHSSDTFSVGHSGSLDL